MSSTHRIAIVSHPAALILALALAALTAPILMLPRAGAVSSPPVCTTLNGCTELSATPPEDTVTVPPNIVLMLDDSGSMAWDFMPDWDYLGTGLPSNWNSGNNGVRDTAINGLYYDPTITYAPPPQADSTSTTPDLYPTPTDITAAFADGFTDQTHFVNVTTYGGDPSDTDDEGNPTTFAYYANLPTTIIADYGAAVEQCPSGYTDTTGTGQCTRASVAPSITWKCVPPPSGLHGPTGHDGTQMCYTRTGSAEHVIITWYPAVSVSSCPSGTTLNTTTGLCDYPTKTPTWQCPNGGGPNGATPTPECTSRLYEKLFTYTTGAPGGYTLRYVSTGSYTLVVNSKGFTTGISGSDCSILYNSTAQANCVAASDTSGVSAPAGVPAGQNVAVWFSYYHTRIQTAKSGLMTAFSKLSANYRFGFGSINANNLAGIPASASSSYGFNDAGCGGFCGSTSNRLANVQPFGDGTPGTQKALFWQWLAGESASSGTPLRMALQAVGTYYQTSQPWSTMPGDPGYTAGSTTTFACRASYAILQTDGFWNGTPPSGPVGLSGASGVNGPVNNVPSATPPNVNQYQAVAPFTGGEPAEGGPSLADVATYYWETDLQPTIPNEVAPSTSDPATWQHMTTFTVGLGFAPTGILPAGTTVPQIFAWAQGGAPIAAFSWPTPTAANNGSINNIADLAHAAVNGHGDFFSVKTPQELANAFSAAIAEIGARNIPPTPASVNASVASLGAVSFSTGYNTGDWSGAFDAVALNTDGTVGATIWSANAILNAAYHSATGYTSRSVFTDTYVTSGTPPTGTLGVVPFAAASTASLDATEVAGLETPALAGGNDTLANRIDYLLGDTTYEGTLYRKRTNGILGAIIRSQPVYVAGATGNYYSTWPTLGGIAPPEMGAGAQTYDAFVTQQASNPGMVYVGANDGMLHAFHASVPTCTGTIDANGDCSAYTTAANDGTEAWAFVPRAVYANLGNLTNASNFSFLPTVDGTPVTRDVFFSEGGAGNDKWHTILVGGVGLGGRGVYALDITNPNTLDFNDYPMTQYPATGLLWELDADMPVSSGCVSIMGSSADSIGCRATDLGFTVPQPNIGRLSDGKWVVLVPNGYFPDCSTGDIPTGTQASCQAIAAQAPRDASGNPYSALFVLDAQTGTMIAELKTPTNISGVTSFGLATPVMGDYNGDQVDDVAFAGDVQGNLWRFDLSSTTPSGWTVTLVYKGLADASGNQGVQPITTMPRLFPDPTTNRFMVVFGTGKFLGVGDNSNNTVQAIYGVRDVAGQTYDQADLTQQYLHETQQTLPDGSTASLRCVTGGASDTCTASTPVNAVPASSGGWFINLQTTTSGGVTNDAGERVVVNPGAVFSSNTVVFETLITGSQTSDPCSPSTAGSFLALSATTGSPSGVSALAGGNNSIAGGRITNAQTSGSLPLVSALGGGQIYLPGLNIAPQGSTVSLDAPLWRRRSWQEINGNQ